MTVAIAKSKTNVVQNVEHNRAVLAQAEEAARLAESIDEVTEIRARVEAARAWAKVHKHVQDIRADLLKVEIRCLIRIAQLDCGDGQALGSLKPSEREAAQWWAAKTEKEIDQYISDWSGQTTAVGLVKAIIRRESQDALNNKWRTDGMRFAAGDARSGCETEDDDDIYSPHSEYDSSRLNDALGAIISDHIAAGSTFTVSEVADAVLAESAFPGGYEHEQAFVDGVREVVRKAVRICGNIRIAGTKLPTTIAVPVPKMDGQFLRVPIMAADVDQLKAWHQMRIHMVERDMARIKSDEAGWMRTLFSQPSANHPGVKIAQLVVEAASGDKGKGMSDES